MCVVIHFMDILVWRLLCTKFTQIYHVSSLYMVLFWKVFICQIISIWENSIYRLCKHCHLCVLIFELKFFVIHSLFKISILFTLELRDVFTIIDNTFKQVCLVILVLVIWKFLDSFVFSFVYQVSGEKKHCAGCNLFLIAFNKYLTIVC